MKVLTVVGSPRRGGNTDTVLGAMVEELEKGGCRINNVYLNEIQMRGCQGCMSCKKATDHCVQKDGMTPVYDLIQESGLVLMGTTVYLWDVTGQFKLFVDRFFAFWEKSYRGRIRAGKTAVLVTVLGQDNIKMGRDVSDKYVSLFKSFGFSRVEPLIFPGVNSRGAMLKRPDYLEAARELVRKVMK